LFLIRLRPYGGGSASTDGAGAGTGVYGSLVDRNGHVLRRAESYQADAVDFEAVAANSISVALWTSVSRLTGLARVAMIAAVLGPTYLGNTFAAIYFVPNVVFELLTGSLFTSLLVPPLVRHVARKDRAAAELLGRGFLGVMLVTFAAIAAGVILAGPLLLHVLWAGAESESVADAQQRVGWLLLALMMPQLVLYGVAGTGEAVMTSYGRFSLPHAASALENLGVIATLVAVAVIFGTGTAIERVTTSEIVLLGLGTTASVGLHAAAQWLGARSVGVSLLPTAGWRDPEVRQVVRRVVPSSGYAGLNGLRLFAMTIVANRVPGGVVAFHLAYNFSNLPTALGANPVATALIPRLSQLHHDRAPRLFRDEFATGASLALFVAVPAAVAYAALAVPIAQAVSFGEMTAGGGETLIALALAGLSVGVLGEAGFVIATSASYATFDAQAPLRSMFIRAGVSLALMTAAFVVVDGPALLLAVGLAMSAGNLISGWHLVARVNSKLPPGGKGLSAALLRAFAGSLVMAAVSWATIFAVSAIATGELSDALVMLAATGAGLIVFVGVERALRSAELLLLLGALRGVRVSERV
jgi:putative peptidoglycan lipid II flippase